MNRMDEFLQLTNELKQTPPALEYAVTRARAKAKQQKRMCRFIALPASSLGALMLAFVLLVNLSIPFAMACAEIPVLAELAELVSFSPTLSAAVENDYVQLLDLEQEQNGITMRIDSVIVDGRQLNIFYEMDSSEYDYLAITSPQLFTMDNQLLWGYGLVWNSGEKGTLNMLSLQFTSDDVQMPNELLIQLEVYATEGTIETPTEDISSEPNAEFYEPKITASFMFHLQFDLDLSAQAKRIEVNQDFMIGGQKLSVSAIDIYPTHIRIIFDEDEANSSWLNSLDCYLENELGERFDAASNAFSASGNENTPSMLNYYMESSYFSESEQLTLFITGARWTEKDLKNVRVDLPAGQAENLPQGIQIEAIKYIDGAWQLSFFIERSKRGMFPVFSTTYYDEAGNEYEYNTGSFSTSEKNGFITSFPLIGYDKDVVYLCPTYSYSTQLDEAISIPIK